MYLYKLWRPGRDGSVLRHFDWNALYGFLRKNCKGKIIYFDEIYTPEYKSRLVWDQDVLRGRVHKFRKSTLESNRNLRVLKKELML